MSLGGDIMEEMYNKQVQEFLVILQEASKSESKEGEEALYWLEKYKKHFKNFGIYGE